MKYDSIFINGDSYSARGNSKVYGDFLSQNLDLPVRNFAIQGSNNQRILRSSIEYLHKIKSEFQNPLVIIGWSLIRRLEVWYYGNNQKLINQMPDSSESRFITLNHVINAGEATLEQKALINEDLFVHKQLMDFYTNLYLFANVLESQKYNYVFFSAARNTDCPIHCFPYLRSLHQVNWVENNPNIFKLHDFCIPYWAKENDPEAHPVTGHLSEDGHKKFSDFVLNNLID